MSFDFDVAVRTPFRMQPGLRRVAALAPQLHEAARGSPHRRAKLDVLRASPQRALLAAEGFDAAAALAALAAQADADAPGWRERLHADPEAADVLRTLPPSMHEAAAWSLAFDEDLAVVDARDTRIVWLAVALPSHWSPQDKIGRSFAEVHAPVADNALVVGAAAHLTRLVSGPDRWARDVWTVTPSPGLDGHPQARRGHWPAGADATPEAVAAQATWRTEHQTFIPVPGAQQAVFTIRVQVRPLAEALDTPARAAALHDAIASMSEAVIAYRGLAPVREPLLRWLAGRAAQ